MWLAASAVAAACLMLAGWQWRRGHERSAADALQAVRAALPPVRLRTVPADPAGWIGRRVMLAGRVVSPPILLDNETRRGRPGWRVHILLELADGQSVLVVRGFADRAALAALPAAPARATGRLAPLPGVRRLLDGPVHDGHLWQALPATALGSVYRVRLAPLALIADPADPPLQPLDTAADRGMTADRHYAYALQWGLMAVAVLAIATVLSRQPARKTP